MIIVYSDPKTGKSAQVQIEKDKEILLIGKKIGDVVDGDIINAPGYKLKITGGTDNSGFAMNKDIEGIKKIKTLVKKKDGTRLRKTVRGNTISADIAQVNAIIVEYGALPVDSLFKPKEKKEENKEEEK